MQAYWKPMGWAALLLTALGVAGCTEQGATPPKQPEAAAATPPPPPPPEVVVDLPTTGEITDFEDFTGRTVGTRTIDLRARVTGYLDKINFKEQEGRDVEKGFVLYEIDARPYEAEVARYKADLLKAESHLKRLELDFKRISRLVESKSVTREQFDLVQGDRNEAVAAIAIARANLDLAELNVSFTKVRAPISGRVGRTMVDAGNVVKADETNLTTIVQIDPIYVYFEVDERSLLRIRRYLEEGRLKSGSDTEGVRVMMGLSDEDQYPRAGVVNFLDNRLDPGTGTLQVRGVFHNTDRILRPGLFVRVRLPVGQPYKALLVSEEALGTDQGQKFVYVIDKEDKAQYRRVEVGKTQDGRRVITKGLTLGERVVVSGLQRVRPGALVQPKMIEAARQRSPGDPEQVAEVDGQSGPLPRVEPLPATDAAAPRKQAVGGAPLAR